MDLSSFDVVRQNLDFLQEMVERKLDIVFANEDESKAFTDRSPRESLDVFSRLCDIAVVKEGAIGSHIATGDRKIFMPAERVQVEDTNGAGDAYAGGVLYGLCRGLDIEGCSRIGTRAGALMVSQKGARATDANAQLLCEYASTVCELGSSGTDKQA